MSWTTMVPSHPLSTLPSLLNMPTMPVMQSLPMSNPLDMSTPLSKSRPAPSRLAMHCFPDFLLHQLAILKVTEKLLSLFFWKNLFISVMNTTCNPFQDHKAQNWGKHLKPVLVVSLNFEKILYIRYIFLGKTSIEKKRFLSGIARMRGGVYPCPNFLALFSTMFSLIF